MIKNSKKTYLRAITLMRRATTTAPVRQWQNCLDESASQFA
jgi:hypothetical protein